MGADRCYCAARQWRRSSASSAAHGAGVHSTLGSAHRGRIGTPGSFMGHPIRRDGIPNRVTTSCRPRSVTVTLRSPSVGPAARVRIVVRVDPLGAAAGSGVAMSPSDAANLPPGPPLVAMHPPRPQAANATHAHAARMMFLPALACASGTTIARPRPHPRRARYA